MAQMLPAADPNPGPFNGAPLAPLLVMLITACPIVVGRGFTVKVASSMVKDAPPGSPAIIIFAMPVVEVTCKRSFGVLPRTPDIAMLFVKADWVMASVFPPESNAVNVTRVL